MRLLPSWLRNDDGRLSSRALMIRRVIAAITALAVIAGVGSFAWYRYVDSQVERITLQPIESLRPTVAPTETPQSVNVLILGVDTRGRVQESLADIIGTRSDTIMIANLAPDGKNLTLMSVMRDIWVDIPEVGEAKINAALSLGGIDTLLLTLEQLIGVRIDHVMLVDFEGVKYLVDYVGGVEIENSIAFTSSSYPPTFFDRGTIELDGQRALSYVRERYRLAAGDYQRVENQRNVLLALFEKLKKEIDLTSAVSVSRVFNDVAPYLVIDEDLTLDRVLQLAGDVRRVKSKFIKSLTIPTDGGGRSDDGQSYVRLDEFEMERLRQAFIDNKVFSYVPLPEVTATPSASSSATPSPSPTTTKK